MDDNSTYTIQLSGQVDEDEINSMSPLCMTVEWVGQSATRCTVCTDQSGIIGLIRHLHGLGYLVQLVSRADSEDQNRNLS